MGAAREAIIRVTPDLLGELLRLPSGAVVVDVARDILCAGAVFVVKVGHPDFPETPLGEFLPFASPEYRRGADGQAVFAGWGDLLDAPLARGGD